MSAKILSVIVPSTKGHCPARVLDQYLNLKKELSQYFETIELIIVAPVSATKRAELEAILASEGVRVIQTKREVSRELAIFAGLQRSLGDQILVQETIDIRLSVALLKDLKDGLSYTLSRRRGENGFYNGLSKMCRPLLRLLGYQLPTRLSYSVAMTRDVASYLLRRRQYNRKLHLQLWRLVEPETIIEKEAPLEKKKTTDGILDFASIIVQSSTATLSYGAVLLFISGLIFSVSLMLLLGLKLLGFVFLEGWASSTILQLLVLSFFTFVSSISFLYMIRILEESSGESNFVVGDELVSNKKIDLSAINVDVE